MRKTYIAICATAALGLCLMAPKGASALPAADGAGKILSQAVTSNSAVTQVRGAGVGLGHHLGAIRAGGIRTAGVRAGHFGPRRAFFRRRGFAPGVGLGFGWPFGFGLGIGAADWGWGWGSGWGYPYSYGGYYPAYYGGGGCFF